jgi:hypothetical protein
MTTYRADDMTTAEEIVERLRCRALGRAASYGDLLRNAADLIERLVDMFNDARNSASSPS